MMPHAMKRSAGRLGFGHFPAVAGALSFVRPLTSADKIFTAPKFLHSQAQGRWISIPRARSEEMPSEAELR